MNISKHFCSAVVGLVMMFSAAPARAGIPVIDVAAILQAVEQVVAWGEQYEQMVQSIQAYADQLKQAKEMTKKLDGLRNLGTILNDPQVFAVLPPEMRNTAQLLYAPALYSTDPNAINQILGSFGLYNTSNASQTSSAYADAIGRAQQIISSTNLRRAQIDRLAQRVNTSSDAKDSLDMMNRNTLEVARINNDFIGSMAAMDAAKQSIELRRVAYERTFGNGYRNGGAAPLRNYN
jgi:type IV secretion system protein VirB5